MKRYKRCPICEKSVSMEEETCPWCGYDRIQESGRWWMITNQRQMKTEIPQQLQPSPSTFLSQSYRPSGKPLTALVGSILCAIGASSYILEILYFLFYLLFSYNFNYEGQLHAMESLLVFSITIVINLIILIGAFLIYRKLFIIGGIVSIIPALFFMYYPNTILPLYYSIYYPNSIYPSFTGAILSIAGGILGLISREDIASLLLGLVRLYGRLEISNLASMLGKNETDIELMIIKIISKGEPIEFMAGTREIIYRGTPSLGLEES